MADLGLGAVAVAAALVGVVADVVRVEAVEKALREWADADEGVVGERVRELNGSVPGESGP